MLRKSHSRPKDTLYQIQPQSTHDYYVRMGRKLAGVQPYCPSAELDKLPLGFFSKLPSKLFEELKKELETFQTKRQILIDKQGKVYT